MPEQGRADQNEEEDAAQKQFVFLFLQQSEIALLDFVFHPFGVILDAQVADDAFLVGVVQAVVLFSFMQKNRLLDKYGLCKSSVSARQFLYYVPLIILATSNLWNGIMVNYSWLEMVCHIILMLCVGFIEEVIFRGFLFKAIAKDNVKTAIIISSVTFGVGHLVNLVNGSGMELVANLFQIVGAIAFGFLFVILFYRGRSLLPCIVTHSMINILSAFANQASLNVEKRMISTLIEFAIILVYALILIKTLPKNRVS